MGAAETGASARVEVIHASTVAVDGRALLISGASGSGKSALALQLMAYGAHLVADDRTELFLRQGALWARAPRSLCGLIEARGIGILAASAVAEAAVGAEVDLDRHESERLPPFRVIRRLGCELPLILRGQGDTFAAGLLQWLRGGRAG